DQERVFLGQLSRAGVGLQPPLPGRVGGGGRSGAGLPTTAATHRAQGGRRPQLCRFPSSTARRRAFVQSGAGWRPHRAWLSQRRYPATALRRPEAISPPTTCQCRGRATAQAVARAPIGGKGPAHTMLASDGTRPKPPRLGCTALSLILATTGGLARCYRAENFSASCREVQRKESMSLVPSSSFRARR